MKEVPKAEVPKFDLSGLDDVSFDGELTLREGAPGEDLVKLKVTVVLKAPPPGEETGLIKCLTLNNTFPNRLKEWNRNTNKIFRLDLSEILCKIASITISQK